MRDEGRGAVSSRSMQGVCKAVSLLYRHFREFVTFLHWQKSKAKGGSPREVP